MTMTAFFSLWDVEVGTSLGTYESESEVLAVVHALILANGEEYAESLDLTRRTQDGDWEAVATGRRLADLARAGAVVPST
jgi:hypothetical protein